jgi:hypothetical protein
MSKLTFFKTQKPRGFDFQPRYYSESKERIEDLRKQYGQERKNELDQEQLRVNIRQNWSRMRKTSTKTSNSSPRFMIFIVIAAILGTAAYLFLK